VREPQIGLKDRTQTPAGAPHPSYTRFPPDNPTPDGNAGALQGPIEGYLKPALTRANPGAATNASCNILAGPGAMMPQRMIAYIALAPNRHHSICQEMPPIQQNSSRLKPTTGHRLSVLGAAESADNSCPPARGGRCDRVTSGITEAGNDELPGLRNKSQGLQQHPPPMPSTRHEVQILNKRISGNNARGGSNPLFVARPLQVGPR